MTIGPIVAAAGLVLLSRIEPGSTYVSTVLPGVVVLGAGLVLPAAPLTTAVLSAVDDAHLGVGSAVNNAVARIAGLLAVAVLPGVAGLSSAAAGSSAFTDGVAT